MRIAFFVVFLFSNLFTVEKIYAQNTEIQWQNILHSESGDDRITSVRMLADSNFIIAGEQNTYDETIFTGYKRVLISKISKNGALLWRKAVNSLYTELANDVTALPDTGFCIVGIREYPPNNAAPRNSFNDVLYYRFDKNGNVVTEKTFGSNTQDYGKKIIQSADGNLVIGAQSNHTNANGDVPAGNGDYDIWLLKIDTSGSIIWSRVFGGSGKDELWSMKQKTGGSILLCGSTGSNDGDFFGGGYHGGLRDGYVLSVSNDGESEWAKLYGDNGDDDLRSLDILPDQSILVAGDNYSATSSLVSSGIYLKLSSSGNVQWQKSLYGQSLEIDYIHLLDSSKNIILAGTVLYPDYNKPQNYQSSFDAFYCVVDAAGNQRYINYYGSSGSDIIKNGIVLDSLNFLSVGHVGAADGWVNGYTNSFYEGFILKSKLVNVNNISGYVFVDYNNNGATDDGEPFYQNMMFACIKNNDTLLSNASGNYLDPYFHFTVDTGTYTIVPFHNNGYYNVLNNQEVVTFNAHYQNETRRIFRAVPVPGYPDMEINLYPVSSARPGFEAKYVLSLSNTGTDTLKNVVANLIIDTARLESLFRSTPIVLEQHADTLLWQIAEIAPGNTEYVDCSFFVKTPPLVNDGDIIKMRAFFTDKGYLTLENDTAILLQTVSNAFDPNGKSEVHAGKISLKEIDNNGFMTYTVFFQNTGSVPAMNVYVRDTFDNKLNWRSLQILGSSHPVSFQLTGNKACWSFENIRLPDSLHDEKKSHGYVVYRIKPIKDNLKTGDTFSNNAAIYFDYNVPVITNTEKTLISDGNGICPGGNIKYTSSVSGTSYQWQVNSGSGYTNVTNSTLYSGTVTATLQITAAPTSLYGYKYRCLVNGNMSSAESQLKFLVNWTGTVSTAWENAANWNCGVVPDGNTDVFIKSGASNYPIVNGSTACHSIKALTTVSVLVKSGVQLLVTGK